MNPLLSKLSCDIAPGLWRPPLFLSTYLREFSHFFRSSEQKLPSILAQYSAHIYLPQQLD
jgi:hypothetical protein